MVPVNGLDRDHPVFHPEQWMDSSFEGRLHNRLQFTSTPVSEGGIDERYANYGEKGYNSPATITRMNVRSTALLLRVCVCFDPEVGFLISSLHGSGCGINDRRMFRIRLGSNAFRTFGSDKLFCCCKKGVQL